jgi:SAM-dependent methyltransferase
MITQCVCCGSDALTQTDVLWQSLIDEWRLSPSEISYIQRQQGLHCGSCGTNLRAMALASAIMRAFNYAGRFEDFVESGQAQALRVLEINPAGLLTQFLSRLPQHTLVSYPEVDMLELPFPQSAWDLVVHSDTLEHVAHPIRGLAECRRVLADRGICAFTVPMIVERRTLSRAGMPPSYHGNAEMVNDDHIVHTEFGCDLWTYAIRAGFPECRIFSLEYPAAQALVCTKT